MGDPLKLWQPSGWLSLRASFGSWSLAGRYIMVLIETGLFTSADPAACCHHKSWPALTQRSHRLRIARPRISLLSDQYPPRSGDESFLRSDWLSRYLLFLCLIIFYVQRKIFGFEDYSLVSHLKQFCQHCQWPWWAGWSKQFLWLSLFCFVLVHFVAKINFPNNSSLGIPAVSIPVPNLWIRRGTQGCLGALARGEANLKTSLTHSSTCHDIAL